MAGAHRGYAIADDTRLRILLGVFEATQDGVAPSRRELRETTGLSNGSLSHHIPLLVTDGLLLRRDGARGLSVTTAGHTALIAADLIAVISQHPVFGITTKGVQLLERRPEHAGEPRHAAP